MTHSACTATSAAEQRRLPSTHQHAWSKCYNYQQNTRTHISQSHMDRTRGRVSSGGAGAAFDWGAAAAMAASSVARLCVDKSKHTLILRVRCGKIMNMHVNGKHCSAAAETSIVHPSTLMRQRQQLWTMGGTEKLPIVCNHSLNASKTIEQIPHPIRPYKTRRTHESSSVPLDAFQSAKAMAPVSALPPTRSSSCFKHSGSLDVSD